MSRRLRIALVALVACAALLAAALALVAVRGGAPDAAAAQCTGADALDFACHERRSLEIVEGDGAPGALRDLDDRMKDSGYVRAACHQLTHRIGRAAGAGTGITAFADGDPLCGAGYYHGVTEAVMAKLGAGAAVRRAASVCAPLRSSGPRSADTTNCVHGMGHGFMGVTGRRIAASLKGCDALPAAWERRGCYSGVFMENHATAGESGRGALRPAAPLYPCTAVARRYKSPCYERQSTYALFVSDGDFAKVFALCARAERGFRGACERGLGGDVAAETKLVAPRREQALARRRLCLLGESSGARTQCVAGAVGVILQDLEGGPAQLDAFCATFERAATQPEHAACLRASEAGYRELLARQTGTTAGSAAVPGDFVCHLKKPGARRRAT